MTVYHLNSAVEMPPYPFLKQIFSNCPKAGTAYIYLWEIKDLSNQIYVNKKEAFMLFHPNTFKNSLRKLATEGLINYIDRKEDIFVEMVNWCDLDE